MRHIILSLLTTVVIFAGQAKGQVSKEQLGQLLLGNKFSIVTLDYLTYYSGGPTSSTTYGGYHPGIDYLASSDTVVYSPISGVVHSRDAGIGRVSIRIDGTSDYFIFLHLSRFDVKEGWHVNVGDTIGLSGSAGTPKPHLHVEVRTNRTVAAYYFKTTTSNYTNKNPKAVVKLDNRAKMTYVFNQMELAYPSYFPVSLRFGSTTYFDASNGYRWYQSPTDNYLYLWNATLWYRIGGQWYNSQASIDEWYYWLGGR